MEDVWIAAAGRSPIGALQGQLAPLKGHEIQQQVIKGLLQHGGISAEAIDEVILGQVLTAGAA